MKTTTLITVILISVFSYTNAYSQLNRCYTDQAYSIYLQNNTTRNSLINSEELLRTVKNNFINKTTQSNLLLTIPVVFHIVYKNATQNIADSNVFRQVDILNECYRLQNANFSQTRPIFDTIAADIDIEFCLASVDPNGNPTTGITHTMAPAGSTFDPLFGFDNVKSSATGGVNPWPTDQYLNIWICDMSLAGITLVLGYATFPGSDPMLDGVVIQYQFTGFMPNTTTNNKGRTSVHEVGHWLGLRHIWGDGQFSTPLCDSTDYVDDTPNADTASQQTCIIKNSCSNESSYWTNLGIDPPDMIENYMDYSYDDCMTMFTNGQKDRMHASLSLLRSSLFSSNGCGLTGVHELTQNSVQLYPNPTDKLCTIDFGINYLSKSCQIKIFDISGRVIKEIESYITNGKTELNVSQLPNGIYIIRIETAIDNHISTRLNVVR